MNKTNQIKGFTLVELIVVIAIIGVLAAILVPTMIGYVNKARMSGANSSAKTLYNAANLSTRQAEIQKPIPRGIYTQDNSNAGTGYDVYVDATFNGFMDEFYGAGKLDGVRWAVLIEEDIVTGACYAKSADDGYVGTYPTPNEERRSSTAYADLLNYAKR